MLTSASIISRKSWQRPVGEQATTGFTFVEILVAIIVLCVLALVMMPAFQNTREMMKATQCMQHLRTLGVNSLGAIQERNGVLVWYDAKAGRNGMWWYNIFQRDDFAGFSSIMTCPSAKKPYLYAYAHKGQPLYGTYRYNKFMGYRKPDNTWLYAPLRLATQKNPHLLALLTDFRHEVADKGDDSTGFETWPLAIKAHRKETTAVVFCLDGHMEQITDLSTTSIVINPARIK